MALNPITYLMESKAELAKVTWPTKMQTLRLTIIVILVSVVVGAYIAGLDTLFATVSERFFYK